MNFNSKKTLLTILAITAIIFSRAMFVFINDPEGPNLLVVVGMAAIVYVLTLGVSRLFLSKQQGGLKKILLLILAQVLIVTSLYFCLK